MDILRSLVEIISLKNMLMTPKIFGFNNLNLLNFIVTDIVSFGQQLW